MDAYQWFYFYFLSDLVVDGCRNCIIYFVFVCNFCAGNDAVRFEYVSHLRKVFDHGAKKIKQDSLIL